MENQTETRSHSLPGQDHYPGLEIEVIFSFNWNVLSWKIKMFIFKVNNVLWKRSGTGSLKNRSPDMKMGFTGIVIASIIPWNMLIRAVMSSWKHGMSFRTLLIISWKTGGDGIATQVIPREVRAAAAEVMVFPLAVDSRGLGNRAFVFVLTVFGYLFGK